LAYRPQVTGVPEGTHTRPAHNELAMLRTQKNRSNGGVSALWLRDANLVPLDLQRRANDSAYRAMAQRYSDIAPTSLWSLSQVVEQAVADQLDGGVVEAEQLALGILHFGLATGGAVA
jgi:hypothetical protein